VNVRKYVPLIILVLVAAFVATVYLPGFLRLLSFKHALGDFLNLIKTGDIVRAADYVVDEEQERVLGLIREYAPEGYEDGIEALRVHRIERHGDEYLIILIVRAQGPHYRIASKARILWRRVRGKWRFPFSGIEVAELVSEDWRSINYLLDGEN